MNATAAEKAGKIYIIVSYKDETGKRKQKWRKTGLDTGSPKRAITAAKKKILEEVEKEIEDELKRKNRVLLVDLVDEWISEKEADPVTLQGYEIQIKVYIKPFFDGIDILSPESKDKLKAALDLLTNTGKKGTPLSASSMAKNKNILSQTLKWAEKTGKIDNITRTTLSCALEVNKKLCSSSNTHTTWYSKDQIKHLLHVAKESNYANGLMYLAVYLSAVYGLRRSEVLGLSWDDVSFDTEQVTISSTYVKITDPIRKNSTKTKSSHRTLPLNAETIMLLERIKEQRTQEQQKSKFVFVWADGSDITPDYISHTYKKLVTRAGLPASRFHDLRHSCASFLLSSGFTLKDTAEWLGHSTIKTTADTYGHLDLNRKKEIASHNVLDI